MFLSLGASADQHSTKGVPHERGGEEEEARAQRLSEGSHYIDAATTARTRESAREIF